MNLENLKIVPPEGMEWYQEGNEIKFRPKKGITYEDIAYKLFICKKCYCTDRYGSILKYNNGLAYERTSDLNNCISEKQAQKLLAINQLMNVAKYLNEDWIPNWDNSNEAKYYIHFYSRKYIDIGCSYQYNYCSVYFKTIDLAQQAIEILGEETIRLALCTDW